MDGRDALVVVGMNGEPLPIEHGFPVRLVVPGLYGFVSATKWLTEIELTTFAEFDHYWLRRGWAQRGADQADEPDRHAARAGQGAAPAPCRSPAWRGRRRSASPASRCSVDDGPWQPAELGDGAVEGHVAAVGLPLGGDAGSPLAQGPGDRRRRRNPNRRACRTNPRRCLRPSPDRRDRRVTSCAVDVNPRKDPP